MKTNFSACFRRFHRGKSFTSSEIDLIESLERQRHRTSRVRAIINDPRGQFHQVLQAYIAYIQHLDRRDAILLTPRCSPVAPMLGRTRLLQATHRSYRRVYGHTRPIGQVLILDAHLTPRLDTILQLLIQYPNGPNSILLIHGTARQGEQALPANPFARWLALSQQPDSIYYLPPSAQQVCRRCPPPPPKFPAAAGLQPAAPLPPAAAGLQPAAPMPGVFDPHPVKIIHNSQLIINNSPPSLPVIPIRLTPAKIPA